MLSLYGDFWRPRALSKTCPISLKFSEVIRIHLILKKSTLRINFSRKVRFVTLGVETSYQSILENTEFFVRLRLNMDL
jgi:hypothetical protein